MELAKLKSLFAHEVLRHAMTAVNGEELDINTALPQYINTEEGFAKAGVPLAEKEEAPADAE